MSFLDYYTHCQQYIRSVCALSAGNALTMSVPIWSAIHPLCLCTYRQQCIRYVCSDGQQCVYYVRALVSSNALTMSVHLPLVMHTLHLCPYGQQCTHFVCALMASNAPTISVTLRPAIHPVCCALAASNSPTTSGLTIRHLSLVLKTAWGFHRRILHSFSERYWIL